MKPQCVSVAVLNCICLGNIIGCQKALSTGKQMALLLLPLGQVLQTKRLQA